MLHAIGIFLASFVRLFRSRRSPWLENLALGQQLAVLKRKHPRPRLTVFDKPSLVIARMYWPQWKQALIVISSENVVRSRRAGFRLDWTWLLASSDVCRQEKRQQGTARHHIPNGCRESHWGCAPHSRRTTNVWFRCFGAHRFSLGAAGAEEPRKDRSGVGVSQKPPRSIGNQLLCGARTVLNLGEGQPAVRQRQAQVRK